MRSLFEMSKSWHYSFGPIHEVDFCFWILERDGLQATPFDKHPAGDETLQAAGLSQAGWWEWLARVVRATGEWQVPQLTKAPAKPVAPPRPDTLWQGPPEVRRRLTALAEEFEEIWDEREGDKLALHRTFADGSDQLWKDLAPYRRQLPPVRVITVGYPGPAHAVVPPATVVLGIGGWRLAPTQLAAAVLTGIRDLAAISATPRNSSRSKS